MLLPNLLTLAKIETTAANVATSTSAAAGCHESNHGSPGVCKKSVHALKRALKGRRRNPI
jgi:hypothetical protein